MGPAPIPTLSPELTWRSTNAIAHLRSASDSDDDAAAPADADFPKKSYRTEPGAQFFSM